MSGSLDVRVLGPFEVLLDGRPVGPAGVKRRGLLALLALGANRPVSVAELIDGLWGPAAPATAVNIVQTYVSAWRKALRQSGRASSEGRLVTAGAGYRFALAASELDAAALERARRDARACASRADFRSAARILGEALTSCTGSPMSDLADLPFRDAAAARLEELRLDVLETWARAELETGSPNEVISVIRSECERHPLRERLTEMLMWALWQDDRQEEALGAYETLRHRLADDLGMDPGAGVREMQTRILRHDARLSTRVIADEALRVPVLPRPADTFVGRQVEVARAEQLLQQSRLVTFIGPGGSGKTRLAIEVARRVATAKVRAAFVDCSPLTGADQIASRVATALQIRAMPGESVIDALVRGTRNGSLFLVLDNLEHLRDAANVAVVLLGVIEDLRILATSRGPLHARGEQLFAVPPLSTGAAGPDELSPAARMFVERAAAVDPDFSTTPERVQLVRAICDRLDGLPLAIELAASRLRLLPLGALADRLHEALDLLDDEPGDRPLRHRALRATVQSSYDLLKSDEQRSFRALAVFRGGWDFGAAGAVTGATDELVVIRHTSALLDAGLIERRFHDDQARFRMLETLRQFAAEQLRAANEYDIAADRHATYFVALAREAQPHLQNSDRTLWLERLEQDRDNVLAAFSWLIASGQATTAAPAACALWRFWHGRGHLQEGRDIVSTVLEQTTGDDDPILRADLLAALGNLTYWQRDWPTAGHLYAEALTNYQTANAPIGMADSHYSLGFVAVFRDDPETAHAHFAAARSGYQSASRPDGVANADAGHALIDRMTGDLEQARRRAMESLAQQERLDNIVDADNIRGLLGSIQARSGQVDQAEATLKQAIQAHHQAGNIFGLTWMLHELAALAATRGCSEQALRLSTAARMFSIRANGGIDPDGLGLTKAIDVAADQLSPDVAARARHRGEAFTVDEAVADALDVPVRN